MLHPEQWVQSRPCVASGNVSKQRHSIDEIVPVQTQMEAAQILMSNDDLEGAAAALQRDATPLDMSTSGL